MELPLVVLEVRWQGGQKKEGAGGGGGRKEEEGRGHTGAVKHVSFSARGGGLG